MVIRWEKPPEANNSLGSGWSGKIVASLLERPNEWALIWESEGAGLEARNKAHNRGQNLKTAASRRGYKIEATTRFDAKAEISRVYARYVKDV
jgi:hypothetical protein